MKKRIILFLLSSLFIVMGYAQGGPAPANAAASGGGGSVVGGQAKEFPRWIWVQLDSSTMVGSKNYYKFRFDGNFVSDEVVSLPTGNPNSFNNLDILPSVNGTIPGRYQIFNQETGKLICTLTYQYVPTTTDLMPHASDIRYRLTNTALGSCAVTSRQFLPATASTDDTYYLTLEINENN